MLKRLVTVAYIAITIALCEDDGPLVRTLNGQIRGAYKVSREGRQFAAFDGIPYGTPPIGCLRFRPPYPKGPWTHIWNATSNTHHCMQVHHFASNPTTADGSEDCLYLNVYSPNIHAKKKLDVIVFFHGGAFQFGEADTHSAYNLMDRDVILVMANYRLGPLGFLSTEDNVVSGNNGMKDQVLVLKWVKKNIVRFGGNPDSVTIAGHSAGGASTHYHMLSPLSRGLFHRAISASGTAFCNWALAENPLQKTRKIGELLGCMQNSTRKLIACLRGKTGAQITETVKHFQPWLYNPYSPFAPTVELTGHNKFLPDLPYNLVKDGHVADLPWLTSVTSEEGLYPAADFIAREGRLEYLEQHWLELAPYILHFDGTVAKEEQPIVAEKIKEYYLKGEPISRKTFPELVQAIGDRLFVVDAEKAAQLQAHVNKAPVYFYRFSYRGSISFSEFFTQDRTLGVAHMDDLFYILPPDLNQFPNYLNSTEDKEMVELLLDVWTNFASTGKPTLSRIQWSPVSHNETAKLN